MARKKIKKTKEQKATEGFFPVRGTDLKYAVEKEYRTINRKSLETVEKIGKPKKTVKKKTRKKSKTLKKSKEYTPQKISLKKNGYELIITEKPQAASKISSALGKALKKNAGGIPYYEVNRNGKKIMVACSVGHLFTLTQKNSGSHTPIFDLCWVPNHFVKKNNFTKRYYDVLLRLVKSAGSITIATDYDVEGEVIGLNIIRHLCGQKDADRMKFSTLTTNELNNAYDEKSNTINWGQAIAGETRHYLDWIYGINLSRALMEAIKTTGKFKLMSIGRVQGPTLNIIVKKERKIKDFVPKKYWQAYITIKDSEKIELKYTKDIFDKKKISAFENLVGKTAKVSTETKSKNIPPNSPFNLTTLQTEAYRLYGFTPSRTLQIAQSLYLHGLISYPRTSSQKLPPSIGYQKILKKLAKKYNVEKLIKRKTPVEGRKNDPAHPSIYPTGEIQETSEEESKLYNLVVKRFLSLFCENATIEYKTIKAEINELKFSTKGASITKKGWMGIYPVKIDEKDIPNVDGNFEIIDMRTEEKETKPPKRYSAASIVSELEKRNLGTKSTRSLILDTLYSREYIRNPNVEATPLGMSLIETLEKYSPIIIDEDLTKELEKETDKILETKKNFEEKKNKVIEKAKKTINEIMNHFDDHREKIGKDLIKANEVLRKQQKKENTLNVCPKCKKGHLAITYSRKTRRFFVACDAYPNCKNTFSLPPDRTIKKTDSNCEECGFPKLIAIRRGKRPWIFCFNPECPTNKERLEEYRKKQKELK